MKKIVLVWACTFLLGVTWAQDTAVNDGRGFYLGIGGGVTSNIISLAEGYFKDDTATYHASELSDTDIGYIVYGGYQFNKIIAVEAAYTDYGSFSDTVPKVIQPGEQTFSNDPSSLSLYANAGYTFANGLRPFGQIGLGYLMVNGSDAMDAIGIIDDSFSMRFGLGVEYAPSKLAGFGFRAAYIEEIAMDFNAKTEYLGVDDSTLLLYFNGMLYAGVQYKF